MSSLISFLEVCQPDWQFHKGIKAACTALDGVIAGEVKKLIITSPPRSSKTTLANHFAAKFLGEQPGKCITAATYSQNLATQNGRIVRDIVDSPRYENLYSTKLVGNTAGYWHTDQDGGYKGVGVTGVTAASVANILLIDDPNSGTYFSNAESERIYDWYKYSFQCRLRPGGAIVIIASRTGENDLVGRCLAEGGWQLIETPALKDGESFWPEQWSVEELLKIKNEVGADMWNTCYQQDPATKGE